MTKNILKIEECPAKTGEKQGKNSVGDTIKKIYWKALNS